MVILTMQCMCYLMLLQDNLLVNLHNNLHHVHRDNLQDSPQCGLVANQLLDQQRQPVSLLDARRIAHLAIQLDNPLRDLPNLGYLLH